MSRRHAAYRAFTDEFILHMDQYGGFPADKAIRKWYDETGLSGLQNQSLANAKHGHYAPLQATSDLIRMLLTTDQSQATYHARQGLMAFMRARGFTALAEDDRERVLSHICTPIADAPQDSDDTSSGLDPLFHGARAIVEIPFKYMLNHAVQGCRPFSNDVGESVRWMFTRVAQLSTVDGPSLPEDAAVAAAELIMGTTIHDYLAHAKDWFDRNPWTVVRAKGISKLHLGMTIVLPLSARAYEQVLEGKRASYELTRDDLEIPSSHLVIEACAENPAALGRPRLNFNLLLCLTSQLSALMRYGNGNSSTSFRWLSFAGTPTAKARLLSTGFQATGRNMARTKVEIVERKFDFLSSDVRILEAQVLRIGAAVLPPAPPLE